MVIPSLAASAMKWAALVASRRAAVPQASTVSHCRPRTTSAMRARDSSPAWKAWSR